MAAFRPSAMYWASRTVPRELDPGTRDFDSTVWVNGADQPKWLHNGSFLCVRRIRTNTAAWNHLSVPDQQVAIGRTKKGGVPLSGGTEFTPLRLDKVGEDGLPSIPLDSHVRLASDTDNKGATMFRRGYSYDNGSAAPDGERDEGLLFLAYVRDIERQFVTIRFATCCSRPSQCLPVPHRQCGLRRAAGQRSGPVDRAIASLTRLRLPKTPSTDARRSSRLADPSSPVQRGTQ